MAKIKFLVDTDVIIDYLKGVKPAKELFRTREIVIYCSVLTKKELLAKIGISNSERKKITRLLSKIKILKIDKDIHDKYNQLLSKYGEQQNLLADYIIAASAWSKNLPLLTRNLKHFEKIEEIRLGPVYKYENF